MGKCRTCGREAYYRRICSDCLREWSAMRTRAFAYAQDIHGPLTQTNHPQIAKTMRRLDKMWKKNRDKFNKEIGEA